MSRDDADAPERGGGADRRPTLPDLVDRAATRFGNRTAVHSAGRQRSFRDVATRSNRIANALIGLCSGPQARVAVLLPNQLEIPECDFGIAKAGMIRVPINTRLTQREREYMLADSGSEVVIYGPESAESVAAAMAAVDTIQTGICVGGGSSAGHDYEGLLARASSTSPRLAHPPTAGSYMLYTSGTTGRPKGALLTNRSRLAAMMVTLAQEQEIRVGDAIVHMASTAHGSGSKILPYFVSGAGNILEPRWDPERLLDLFEAGEATASFMVPTMLGTLTEAAEGRRYRSQASSLRTITYGGAPMAPARLLRASATLGNTLVQVYGSAEAPNPILLLSKQDHLAAQTDPRLLGAAGHETLLSQVRLVGEGGHHVTDASSMGELWVRGPTVMTGYWNRPEETSAVLTRDGWYKTGDVARRDTDGTIFIVDRVRDMIITGGYNVYPAEVEAVIASHPEVAEVAVFGIPDSTWGEAVTAVVATIPGSSLTAEEIVAHCQQALAGYKKPRRVDLQERLPTGATGKILRRELRDRYMSGSERKV